MADELAKFGIKTEQDPDSITVFPRSTDELNTEVVVHCYDDHRVALAFSCLAQKVAGTVLDEKRCVEKTWPNWWDDLQNKVSGPYVIIFRSKFSDWHPCQWCRCPPSCWSTIS